MLRLPIILTIASFTLARKLDVVYEWKYIDYLWESKEQRSRAISENVYNYTLIYPYHVQKVQDGRVFVSTPQRFPNAVPASLSTVSEEKCPGGPLLKPYPNWEWHSRKDCKRMISVRRIDVDACNRLWVLDNGRAGSTELCPAKLLVFDLKTDKLLQSIEIPDDISHSPENKTLGQLNSLVVETRGNDCSKTSAYAADFLGGGLVIYDGSKLWRRDDDVFKSTPASVDITIAGETVNLVNGLFGLALTPEPPSGCRRLFFRGTFSPHQNSVSVDDLHKLTPEDDIPSTTSKYRYPDPPATQAFSRDGILIYGLIIESAIGCWNLRTPLNAEHVDIVARNNKTLQFISSVKMIEYSDDPSREEVWVLSTSFQQLLAGTMNFKEINFRVFRSLVDDLVKNSKCDLQSSSKSSKNRKS